MNPPALARSFAARTAKLLVWIFIGVGVGAGCGVLCAFFLAGLEWTSHTREQHPWLPLCLPVAGLAMGVVMKWSEKSVPSGSTPVIHALHDEGAPYISARMLPLVLFGTLTTHLFGGSAGREGTAVQMGASLADMLVRCFSGARRLRPFFLAAGVAGGFGSVFGTPIAGVIFSLEFAVIGRLEYATLVSATLAAITGDWVSRQLGASHSRFPVAPLIPMDVELMMATPAS